jgi:hypothetical protein
MFTRFGRDSAPLAVLVRELARIGVDDANPTAATLATDIRQGGDATAKRYLAAEIAPYLAHGGVALNPVIRAFVEWEKARSGADLGAIQLDDFRARKALASALARAQEREAKAMAGAHERQNERTLAGLRTVARQGGA